MSLQKQLAGEDSHAGEIGPLQMLRNVPKRSSLSSVAGCGVFSLTFVLVIAGLAFGGAMAVIGFGGLLGTSLHRALGTPLPLPTLHNAYERRLYLSVGTAGFLVWASAFLYSLKVAP